MARLLEDLPAVAQGPAGGVRVGLVPDTVPGLDNGFFCFPLESWLKPPETCLWLVIYYYIYQVYLTIFSETFNHFVHHNSVWIFPIDQSSNSFFLCCAQSTVKSIYRHLNFNIYNFLNLKYLLFPRFSFFSKSLHLAVYLFEHRNYGYSKGHL